MNVAERPGFDNGRTIVVKILNLDAPSNAAFSYKSIGML